MNQTFIDDGYTRDGRVNPVPGLHAGLVFTFRPALPEARHAFQLKRDRAQTAGDEGAYTANVADTVAGHVASWVAPEKFREVSPANVRRLHPAVLAAVLDQVLGYEAPDALADQKN